jgi:MFS family permease
MFKKYINCASAALIYFYDFLQMNMLNTLGVPIIEKLSLTMQQYGIFASLYFYFMIPSFLLAGFILDQYNTKRVILSIAFLYTMCAFFLCRTNGFEIMCIGRAISGFCGGFCLLSSIVLASKEFGKAKISKITGIIITVGMLGGVVAQAPLQIILFHFGIDNALMINALLGLTIFIIIYLIVDDKSVQLNCTTPVHWKDMEKLFKNSQLVVLGIYSGLLFLPMSVLGGFCGTEYLLAKHNIDITVATCISGLIFVGVICGSAFFGFISGNIVTEKICMIMGISMTLLCCISILFFTNGSIELLSVLFLFIGFFSSSQILSFPLVAQMIDQNTLGTGEGIVSIIIMLISALLQTSLGYVLSASGNYNFVMAIFLILLIIGTIISFFIKQPEKESIVH